MDTGYAGNGQEHGNYFPDYSLGMYRRLEWGYKEPAYI